MSGPESTRGGDAFDDFFGDPTSSGRMGPLPTEPGAAPSAEDQPTQDVDLARRTEQPTQAAQPLLAIEPEPTPQGAVPEDWWDPEPVTTPSAPAAAAGGTWQTVPAQQPSPYHDEPRRSGRSTSPLGLVALLVGGVLLGGLCVGGTVMAMGGGGDEPTAQTTVTQTSSPDTTQPTSSTSSEESSTTSSTKPTTTSSTKAKPTRSNVAPAGVKQCAGPSGGAAVGAGSTVTSCEFATAVRDAYLAAAPDGGIATVRVTSPVTDKAYTMRCTGADVTRCTGGNDAVVVIY